MNEIDFESMGFSSSDDFKQWQMTVPGKILSHIETLSREKSLSFSMNGRTSSEITFQLGSEAAHLYQKNVEQGIPQDRGQFKVYYEKWEYNYYPWWKDALDSSGSKDIIALPCPISKMHKLSNSTYDFSFLDTCKIIDSYELNPRGLPRDSIEYFALSKATNDLIQKIINPVIAPQYSLEEVFHELRIIPASASSEELFSNGGTIAVPFVDRVRNCEQQLREGFHLLA